jgi:hypothetical protein
VPSPSPIESPSSPSSASFVPRKRDERPRLHIQADIVIYGETQPGTEVIIDGIPVDVRSDGTFDLRLAVPLEAQIGPASTGPAPPGSREERVEPGGEP